MEQVIQHRLSTTYQMSMAALVIVIIVIIALIGLGIWFFVERDLFLYPRYKIGKTQIANSGTYEPPSSIANGVGDSVWILNPATPTTATISVTLKPSTNNAKGQFFYILYPENAENGSSNSGNNLTINITGQSPVTVDVSKIVIAGGRAVVFLITDTNTFKSMGTTVRTPPS